MPQQFIDDTTLIDRKYDKLAGELCLLLFYQFR